MKRGEFALAEWAKEPLAQERREDEGAAEWSKFYYSPKGGTLTVIYEDPGGMTSL